MSTREELLSVGATNDTTSLISNTIEKDQKFLRRTIQELDNKIEDAEAELQDRLKSTTPIDASVVKITYKKLFDLVEEKQLFEAFAEDFFEEEDTFNQN